MPADATKRILIVDDSIEYLTFMQLLLNAEGFEAEVASTTANLGERVRALQPDLVIADVRIPGQPPFAVLDLLDGDASFGAIPVLLCTGAVQDIEAQRDNLRRPGRDVLFKPFDITDLLDRIARLCNGAGSNG